MSWQVAVQLVEEVVGKVVGGVVGGGTLVLGVLFGGGLDGEVLGVLFGGGLDGGVLGELLGGMLDELKELVSTADCVVRKNDIFNIRQNGLEW